MPRTPILDDGPDRCILQLPCSLAHGSWGTWTLVGWASLCKAYGCFQAFTSSFLRILFRYISSLAIKRNEGIWGTGTACTPRGLSQFVDTSGMLGCCQFGTISLISTCLRWLELPVERNRFTKMIDTWPPLQSLESFQLLALSKGPKGSRKALSRNCPQLYHQMAFEFEYRQVQLYFSKFPILLKKEMSCLSSRLFSCWNTMTIF